MRCAVVAVIAMSIGCGFDAGAAAIGGGGDAAVTIGDAPLVPMPDATPDATPDAPAPPMMVQSIDPGYTVTTLTIPIALTAGNLVIVAAYTSTLDLPIVLTDTAHLTWASTPAILKAASCAPQLQLFYAQVPATEMDSVTITQSSLSIGAHVVEYSGLAATSPVDVAGGMVAPAASNVVTTGTITTTASDMVFALFADLNGTGAMTAGSDWIARGTDTGFYTLIVDDAPGVAPGAIVATATLPGNKSDACWTSAAVALRVR